MLPFPRASYPHPRTRGLRQLRPVRIAPDGVLSWKSVMLGLLMMSVPHGIAVGLSTVALVWAEPDGSVGGIEDDTSPRSQRDRR
jgi:hypothetical protein